MQVSAEQDSLSELARLDAAADTAIATCDGDIRATVRALILANEFLEIEAERYRIDAAMWRDATSTGYTRYKREWTAKEIEQWGQAALDRMDAQWYE